MTDDPALSASVSVASHLPQSAVTWYPAASNAAEVWHDRCRASLLVVLVPGRSFGTAHRPSAGEQRRGSLDDHRTETCDLE